MTAKLKTFWDKFGDLSPEQIQELQQRIANQIQLRPSKPKIFETFAQKPANFQHQVSLEEEALSLLETLALIYTKDELVNLTNEEIAEMINFEQSQLPQLPKSLAEMISEDREDRF